MWPLSPSREFVRVGRERVERWMRGRDGFSLVAFESLDECGNPEALRRALERLRSHQGPRRPVDVVIESAWLPVMPLRLGSQLWPRPKVAALLEHQIAQLYGRRHSADVCEWAVCVDYRAGDDFALGFALSDAVQRCVVDGLWQAGLRAVSLQPALAWGWKNLTPKFGVRAIGWWLWIEQDRALVCWVKMGRVRALNAGAARPSDDDEVLRTAASEALREGVEVECPPVVVASWDLHRAVEATDSHAEGRVRWVSAALGVRSEVRRVRHIAKLGLDVVKPRMPIDFLRHPRMNKLGAMLLVVGVAMFVGSLWLDAYWRAEQGIAQRLATDQADKALHASRAAVKPQPLTGDERRFVTVASQLNQPWLPTLRLIEALAVPPIYLTAMQLDPATGTLRIDGEAPGLANALEFVAQMNSPRLLGRAQLRVHEPINGGPGGPTIRFSATAQWAQK